MPGIGPKNRDILMGLTMTENKEAAIENTFQLIGKFLVCKILCLQVTHE